MLFAACVFAATLVPEQSVRASLEPLRKLPAVAPDDPTQLMASKRAADDAAAEPAPIAASAPAAPDELAEYEVDDLTTQRTRLSPNAAAEMLASAWLTEAGSPLEDEGLAVLWAHWALETGRGTRMVGHNFAGLKGAAPAGGTVALWTRERHDGRTIRVRRHFRAYSSAEEGARDYVALLRWRYPEAFRAAGRGHVNDFVTALSRGRYFTDDPAVYLRAMRSLWNEFLELDRQKTIKPSPI